MASKGVTAAAKSKNPGAPAINLGRDLHKVQFQPEERSATYGDTEALEWFEDAAFGPDVGDEVTEAMQRPALASLPRAALIKPPVPWTRQDPPMKLGRHFFGGQGEIHPMDFVHGAAFGATGSGKTVNVVQPFAHAAIAYTLCDGSRSAVLVIDPKKELADGIRQLLDQRGERERLVVIGACAAIQMFPQDCELSASDRFELYREMVPQGADSDNLYWRQKADAMLVDLLELELAYHARCGGRFMARLAAALKLSPASLTGYWPTLRSVLAHACQGQKRLRSVAATIEEVCAAQGVVSPSVQVFGSFTGGSDTVDQACYVVMSAQSTVNALSDPSIDALVDLDVLGGPGRTNVQELIEQAKVIVFQPEPTTAHTVAAKALKQRFFEAVYKRSDLRQPVFFVADEYQTFVSAKDTSLLDRSRAYRTVALLATQSLASLRHALGSNPAAANVVEILVTNLPSRYSFRSNCAETIAWLKTQIPASAEGTHILDVRRLALLKPGEAYYMQADGNWGFDRPGLPLAA